MAAAWRPDAILDLDCQRCNFPLLALWRYRRDGNVAFLHYVCPELHLNVYSFVHELEAKAL